MCHVMSSASYVLALILVLAVQLRVAESELSVANRQRHLGRSNPTNRVAPDSDEEEGMIYTLQDDDNEEIEDEMRELMRTYSGRSNSFVSEQIYSFLSKKYSHKRWFVIVYTAVRRLHSNVLTGSPNCHVVFREGHKNAAAFSYDSGSFFGARGASSMYLSASASQPKSVVPRSEAMVCRGYGDECNRSGKMLMVLLSSSLETWKRPIPFNGRITTLESILSKIC